MTDHDHLREAGSMDGTPSKHADMLSVSMGDGSPNACRAVAAGLGADPERRGAAGAGLDSAPREPRLRNCAWRESTSEGVTAGETALHQPARDLSRVAVRTCPISGLESHR